MKSLRPFQIITALLLASIAMTGCAAANAGTVTADGLGSEVAP